MHVSTLVRRTLAMLAVTTMVVACSDAPSGPATQQGRVAAFHAGEFAIAAARYADEARGNSVEARGSHASGKGKDEIDETRIIVDPRVSRTYAFGRNWIYFPSYSICDPVTSGYGIGTWDLPCEPLRTPIQIQVRWKHKGGHGYVEFDPDLRFVPSPNLRDWVMLAIYDRKRLDSEDYLILWRAKNGTLIDEAATDPTLRASVDRSNGTVNRRIKHFSGYLVLAGLWEMEDGGFRDAY